MKPKLLALITLLALVSTIGCVNVEREQESSWKAASLPVGAQCRVSLRRDCLGVASDNGVGFTADVSNDQSISVSGKIVRNDDAWVVLDEGDGDETWIPHHAILMINVEKL